MATDLFAARAWLSTSATSRCSTIIENASSSRFGNCTTGQGGVVTLHAKSLVSAVIHCLQLCESCPKCVYISVSMTLNECYWHTEAVCLKEEHHQPQGLRTGLARQLVAAPQWMERSHSGSCGDTWERGDCTDGDSGSFGWKTPPKNVSLRWTTAVQDCLHLCATCNRCRFVTVSEQLRQWRESNPHPMVVALVRAPASHRLQATALGTTNAHALS
mmetsp:Transcript_38448/g.87346  ORF Transcript_38448/g.87346 Transcript_38448/m.87346 type:complete len:216 (+) Transcript_38448:82-729(+)